MNAIDKLFHDIELANKKHNKTQNMNTPTETETPIKDIYFKFYDEYLSPSVALQAARNFDRDADYYTQRPRPKNIEEALSDGFIFEDTPEGHGYWSAMTDKFEQEREEETEEPSVLPDSGDRSEFTTGAVRDASYGKGIPSLIPIEALRAVSKRFEDGATKYGRDNWKKGIPLSRYVDSLQRHLWQLMEGDTAEDHGGAIIWNAMCLVDTKKRIEDGELPKELNDL